MHKLHKDWPRLRTEKDWYILGLQSQSLVWAWGDWGLTRTVQTLLTTPSPIRPVFLRRTPSNQNLGCVIQFPFVPKLESHRAVIPVSSSAFPWFHNSLDRFREPNSSCEDCRSRQFFERKEIEKKICLPYFKWFNIFLSISMLGFVYFINLLIITNIGSINSRGGGGGGRMVRFSLDALPAYAGYACSKPPLPSQSPAPFVNLLSQDPSEFIHGSALVRNSCHNFLPLKFSQRANTERRCRQLAGVIQTDKIGRIGEVVYFLSGIATGRREQRTGKPRKINLSLEPPFAPWLQHTSTKIAY